MNFDGIITSKQNRTVIDTCRLYDRRVREERRLFVADGVKLACEAVKNRAEIQYMLISRERADSLNLNAGKLYGVNFDSVDCKKYAVPDCVFEKISDEKSPEGIICVIKYIDKIHKIATMYNEDIFGGATDGGMLLLESVRDPGNVGTVIRTATAFGAGVIVLSSDCADIYNPKTVRGSMGTLFAQKIIRTENMAGFIDSLRACGKRVFASALDKTADRLDRIELNANDCIAVGNEGHGLSDSVIKACTGKLYIPMTENAESLNAAQAATVFLWELCGKRNK